MNLKSKSYSVRLGGKIRALIENRAKSNGIACSTAIKEQLEEGTRAISTLSIEGKIIVGKWQIFHPNAGQEYAIIIQGLQTAAYDLRSVCCSIAKARPGHSESKAELDALTNEARALLHQIDDGIQIASKVSNLVSVGFNLHKLEAMRDLINKSQKSHPHPVKAEAIRFFNVFLGPSQKSSSNSGDSK